MEGNLRTLSGRWHDSIESKITLTGDTGATTLSGTLIHKRVKKP